MASTYNVINTQTLSSATATVTFASIPSTYTNLVIVANVSGPTSGIESFRMRYNSDSGTNYSTTWMRGDGSSASSGKENSNTALIAGRVGNQSGMMSVNTIQIANYANTTTYKTMLVRSSAPQSTAGEAWTNVGLWRSTAAISSIALYLDTSNMSSGSTFTLYGIKAA